MATRKGNTSGTVRAEGTHQTADRITIALVPKAAEDLARLLGRTALNKTDLVNRAITLYEFIDAQLRADRELLVRDKSSGDTQVILIL